MNQQVVRTGTRTPFMDDLPHRITIRFVVNQSHFFVELNELAPQMFDRQLFSRLPKNESKTGVKIVRENARENAALLAARDGRKVGSLKSVTGYFIGRISQI